MKKALALFSIFIAGISHSQSVSGYWYGNANVKVNVEFTFEVALRDSITDTVALFAKRDLRNAVARAEAVVEMFTRYL